MEYTNFNRNLIFRAANRGHQLLAEHVPWLGAYKRRLSAVVGKLSRTRLSYSQHSEDRFINNELANYDLRTGIYVDVGANHPCCISNTYLFYRRGYYGITIEPNSELTQLHRMVRPRDITLSAACGERCGVAKLLVSRTPVVSTLTREMGQKLIVPQDITRIDYVPLVTVDQIVSVVAPEWIFFLNVDTEGSDVDVLRGSTHSLRLSLLLCIEANTPTAELAIRDLLEQQNWQLIKQLGCNLIFRNGDQRFDAFRSKDESNQPNS